MRGRKGAMKAMRRILFRGKNLFGKWIEGDLIQYIIYGKMHIARNSWGQVDKKLSRKLSVSTQVLPTRTAIRFLREILYGMITKKNELLYSGIMIQPDLS